MIAGYKRWPYRRENRTEQNRTEGISQVSILNHGLCMEIVQFVYIWLTDEISVRGRPGNFLQIKASRPYIQHTSKSNKNLSKVLALKSRHETLRLRFERVGKIAAFYTLLW